ncbi:MAG: choice-of-anchor tandem repeat GloVer-containing protein [Pseudomonadota bacterium]
MHFDRCIGLAVPVFFWLTRESILIKKIFLASAFGIAVVAAIAGQQAQAESLPRYRAVYAFDQVKGSGPTSELLKSKWTGKLLLGTTQTGGAHNLGTLFLFDPDTRKTLVVHSFNQDGIDGFYPSGLTDANHGAVLGVTNFGGAFYNGTIYKVSVDGKYQVLHSFEGAPFDGMYPESAPVAQANGTFVGTTSFGGVDNAGTIYRLAADGKVTLMHSFSGPDGKIPQFGLAVGPDGLLYGTTNTGGENDSGTIYKVLPNGSVQTVYAFDPSTSGVYPRKLVLGRDGDFYGVASGGGSGSGGTAFRVTKDGALTVLHNFAPGSAEGDYPNGLTLGTDGLLYGTTGNFGSDQLGSVFQMTTSGAVKVLHKFGSSSNSGQCDWKQPLGAPTEVSNGDFFGTTSAGGVCGSPGYGTIYKLDK